MHPLFDGTRVLTRCCASARSFEENALCRANDEPDLRELMNGALAEEIYHLFLGSMEEEDESGADFLGVASSRCVLGAKKCVFTYRVALVTP